MITKNNVKGGLRIMDKNHHKKLKKRATLIDVARLSGVSTGTISRILNNHPSVSEEARKKVEEAIKKLNYVPLSAARSLAKGVSNTIMLSIIEENPILPSTWRYELPVVQGIYDYLKKTSYNLQIGIGFVEEAQKSKFFENLIKDKYIDGLLILGSWPINYRSLLYLEDRNIPYVLIGCKSTIPTRVEINFDNHGAIVQVIDYLVQLGHTKFALIGGFADQLHMVDRANGFRDALIRRSLLVYENLIKFGDYQIESGYQLMLGLFNEHPRPTAIICGNDFMAAGVIKAIHDKGYKVPEDFSVVGFDDNEVAKVISPPLTTIKVPVFEMGSLAVEKLCTMVESNRKLEEITIMPCEIIIRSSTGKCKEK